MCFQLSLHCLRYLFFTKSMYELFQDICNRLVFSFSLFQFLLQSRHVRFSTLNGGNRKNVNFKNSLPRTTCRITLIKDRQNNLLLPQYKKNFNHLRCFYLFKQYILIEDLSQNTVKKKKSIKQHNYKGQHYCFSSYSVLVFREIGNRSLFLFPSLFCSDQGCKDLTFQHHRQYGFIWFLPLKRTAVIYKHELSLTPPPLTNQNY